MPNPEAERAVAAYFHAVRALSKRKPAEGSERIVAVMRKLHRRRQMAEQHAWDTQWG